MSVTFTDIVDNVQQLSVTEQKELHDLLEKYLIEARREEIFRNYEESINEELESSSDIERLKELIDA
jgi:hypothetical protein